MEIKFNLTGRFWENVLWPAMIFVWLFRVIMEKLSEKTSAKDRMEFWSISGILGCGFGGCAILILMFEVWCGVWWSWSFVWLWGFWLVTCIRNYNKAWRDRYDRGM